MYGPASIVPAPGARVKNPSRRAWSAESQRAIGHAACEGMWFPVKAGPLGDQRSLATFRAVLAPPAGAAFASIEVFHTNMRTLSMSLGVRATGTSIFVFGSNVFGSAIHRFAHS